MFTILLYLVVLRAEAWFTVSKHIQLEFLDNYTKMSFTNNHIDEPARSSFPLSKSPVSEVVVQRFHFTSNTALYLNLHDAFCAGQSYSVFDNGWFLADNFPSLPTICGVSTQSLQVIYSPQFMTAEYALAPGNHRLIILVKGSRIGGEVTSMRVTLLPNGPVYGSTPVIKMGHVSKTSLFVSPDIDLNALNKQLDDTA